MKGNETGKDKVKKICDILRKETLEPARVEADAMIQKAHAQVEQMLQEARKTIEKMGIDATLEIERQKNVFQSSLSQACKQALESLKQNIEEKLFNQELSQLLTAATQTPKVLEQMITAVIRALETQGVEADLSVVIPSEICARDVNALLAKNVIERLKEKSVLVGPIGGGIELKLHNEKITVDITAAALNEVVARYLRKDFRELIFGKTSSESR